MNSGKPGDGSRHTKLLQQGIDAEFKGWNTGECKHILLAPSSQTVCTYMHSLSQEDWIKQASEEIKIYTDRPITMRNKPRPNNEWWNTDIKDELKDCHALVTNMSLSAVDAVLNKVPVITHQNNVCYPLSADMKEIDRVKRKIPPREIVTMWLRCVANNQFTLQEIEDGTAYRLLNEV
tara:strand:- start:180 stop:713 length:534 start_codon:yes stop_codon:yes gene_type:complete